MHVQLGAGVSPHRVCVSGAQPTHWRGPWGRCDSAEGSPCDVLMSACVVCRLERFARYLGRREGEGGGEGGRQEAALVSSLSSLANGDGGKTGKARPFPPLPMGVIIHIILANQKNKIYIYISKKLHHRWIGYTLWVSHNPMASNMRIGFDIWWFWFASLRISKALWEREKVGRPIWHLIK